MNKSVEHIQTLEGTHKLKKVYQITDNCAPHYKSVNHFYQQVSFVINPSDTDLQLNSNVYCVRKRNIS